MAAGKGSGGLSKPLSAGFYDLNLNLVHAVSIATTASKGATTSNMGPALNTRSPLSEVSILAVECQQNPVFALCRVARIPI